MKAIAIKRKEMKVMFQRTGFQTFLRLSEKLCRLFGTYRGSITAAVNASSLSDADKAKVLAIITTIDTACAALQLVTITWES